MIVRTVGDIAASARESWMFRKDKEENMTYLSFHIDGVGGLGVISGERVGVGGRVGDAGPFENGEWAVGWGPGGRGVLLVVGGWRG